MKIFNSISSKKQDLVSIEKDKINLYVCGMTVYDDCHIGHARTFISFDLFVRFFSYLGYKVNYVRNITDIEDKIIDKAKLEKVSFSEISDRFIFSMHHDFSKLNLLSPKFEPRASENLPEILEMIEELEAKEFAYSIDGGDVYFDINSYEDYGKLSKRKQKELESGSRVEIDENKKNPNDFVLWKRSDEEPLFDSKWGKGRPGWHTECAVMIKTLFDGRLDIHCGGIDLKFPHHENESAQIEAIQKHNLSNYWLHAEHLNMDDEKMSKSLGNFIDVSTLIEKNGSDVVRLFLLSAHYRTKVSFSQKKLDECKKMIEKIKRFAKNFKIDNKNIELKFSSEHELFFDALNDDLNTPGAIGVFFSFISEMNKKIAENTINDADKEKSLVFLKLFNSIFDILDFNNLHDQNIPKELQDLLVSRQEARKNLDWKLSDSIRDKIESLGWQVEDTSSGQNLSKKK